MLFPYLQIEIVRYVEIFTFLMSFTANCDILINTFLFGVCLRLRKFTIGRQALGCAISVFVGLAQPALFQVVLQPLLTALIYAYFGPVAALFMFLAGTGSAAINFGAEFALIGGLASVIPASVVLYGLTRRKPYFQRMRDAILAQFAAIVLALAYAYFRTEGDLLGFAGAGLDAMLRQQSPEFIGTLFSMLASAGVIPPAVSEGASTLDAQRLVLQELFTGFMPDFQRLLPGLLLEYSVLGGLLTTVWSSIVCVRRGDEPPVPHVPLTEWHVPNRLTLGVGATAILSVLLQSSGVQGAEQLVLAVTNLLYLIFMIEAMAVIAKMLRLRGSGRGFRTFMLIMLVFFAPFLLRLVGAYFCLFGPKGLISTYIKKRRQKSEGEGDDS